MTTTKCLLVCGLVVGCSQAEATQRPPPAEPLVVPALTAAPVRAAATPPAPPVASPTGAHRAREVITHEEWVGKEVTTEVVESLWDADHSSAADDGEYDVQVVDVGATRFKLTPGQSPDERSAGALASLPRDLEPPMRVTGIVAKTPHGLRLVVHRLEAMAFPTPLIAPSGKAIVADPTRWAGAYVQLEGTWRTAFELSAIDGVWIGGYPSANVRCRPPAPPASNGSGFQVTDRRVRVTGYVYTETGHYGHLGMAPAELQATDIVFLDPKRSECR